MTFGILNMFLLFLCPTIGTRLSVAPMVGRGRRERRPHAPQAVQRLQHRALVRAVRARLRVLRLPLSRPGHAVRLQAHADNQVERPEAVRDAPAQLPPHGVAARPQRPPPADRRRLPLRLQRRVRPAVQELRGHRALLPGEPAVPGGHEVWNVGRLL